MFKRNELEVMEVFWRENKPLTYHEILDLSTERSWKSSTIHFILNGLLDKGSIHVVGTILSGKVYARQYEPTISRDEYKASEIENALTGIDVESKSLSGVFAALVKGKKVSQSTLDDLQKIIDELKEEEE